MELFAITQSIILYLIGPFNYKSHPTSINPQILYCSNLQHARCVLLGGYADTLKYNLTFLYLGLNPLGYPIQLIVAYRFNRLLQSQTDFSAGKIFDPHFFLENILDLCHKMVINQKIPSPGPPGAPGGLLRAQTPQNKKIALLTKVL